MIALLTDFGTRDGYVGAVKGVLLSRAPGATILDLAHDIPAGDVEAAGFALAQVAGELPAGAVCLSVVDPGVGGSRRALAVASRGLLHVAPDNGLLARVLEGDARARVHSIEGLERTGRPSRPDEVSAVFHGRDVFAPAAAWLACGGPLRSLGPRVELAGLVLGARPRARWRGGVGEGAVVHVDRFGNLITNLRVESAVPTGVVELAGAAIPTARTYGDVAPGQLLAVRGSSGWLEVACNRGSAADVLGARPGSVVTWRLHPPAPE